MRTLNQIQPGGKTVFCRVDFNVPLEGGRVASDARITSALPTINYLLSRDARVVLASHLGRPKGKRVPELSLAPVAARLQELVDTPVRLADGVTGPPVWEKLAQLARGEALLLENLRFEPGEEAGDPDFAERLADGVDLYVNEAFACSHRPDASIVALAERRPAYAGFQLEKEIRTFRELLDAPRQPFYCVLGGAKVADKLPVLESLLSRVQGLVIGGGMAYTFLAARGEPVGASRVERELVETARGYLERARKAGIDLVLPTDHVVAREVSAAAERRVVTRIEDGWMGLDVGPETIQAVERALARAATVFWNGPLGVFELEPFRTGTHAVCEALADSEAVRVIGGGDSVRAAEESGLAGRMGHLSTGGGASLELLAGNELPGVAALERSAAR